MEKLEVGVKLCSFELEDYEIVKVGRKWYTTKKDGAKWREVRVDIETLKTEKDYLGRSEQLYINRSSVQEIRERYRKEEIVTTFFGTSWDKKDCVKKLANEDLDSILQVINNYN